MEKERKETLHETNHESAANVQPWVLAKIKNKLTYAMSIAAIVTMPACDALKDDILPACAHVNEIKKTSAATNNQWCYIPWTVETIRVCTEQDCLAGTYKVEMAYLDYQRQVLTSRFLTTQFTWCLDITTQAVPYDFCARTLHIKVSDAAWNLIAEEYISP
jgi:hypothetical protein